MMYLAFEGVINRISAQHAQRYAISSAEALSAHVSKDISLLSRVAGSPVLIEWLQDEFDDEKKARALEMLRSIVGELYSFNLYLGFESSLNEYSIDYGSGVDITPIAVLDPNEPGDAWYFETVVSSRDYELFVDIDEFMRRKRVWLNYKIESDGVTLGIICTGLEFSHVVSELFSQYDDYMRGVIVDGDGIVYMDSVLIRDSDFLFDLHFSQIEREFIYPEVYIILEDTYESHPGTDVGYWNEVAKHEVIILSSSLYRYMSIVPIRYTDWSIMIFSGTTTLFDTTYFIPVVITVLLVLVAFAMSSSVVNYRIMYKPLNELEKSLTQLNDHNAENIYGIERDDELGHLSNTIHDLFTKANIDSLTGLYNRRFMDSNMERVMRLLSRTGGLLSVLMIDIDFFKRYNDTYGHEEGDKCLKAVAHAIVNSVSRVNDIVVRYGGEEFVMILPNTDEEGARRFAEEVLSNVRKLNLPHVKSDAAAYVTISVGVTTSKVGHKHELAMYIKRADEALYMSKKNGRDRYTYFDFNP
jgi:diguanylate cyclase (GGDEF)-like protein